MHGHYGLCHTAGLEQPSRCSLHEHVCCCVAVHWQTRRVTLPACEGWHCVLLPHAHYSDPMHYEESRACMCSELHPTGTGSDPEPGTATLRDALVGGVFGCFVVWGESSGST
jgi:hypothetical protein